MSSILLGILIVVVLVAPSVVCWLKGKRLWATLGIISQWHWIPTFRLAKPDSWWAGRFYDTYKMNLAKQRFGERWS
jgi:hypothetical protein